MCAGKSTLLKLMCGDIQPTRGDIKRHSHLVIGRYHQHSIDVLDDRMQARLPSASFTLKCRGLVSVLGLPADARLPDKLP